ncbi:MAG TPA: L-lysine 6-transaminase [Planctomycetota bacterium]|jgi:L-lysine 6-transaminase|nr:L-lysine 6-transaminase [Planctomycetota bacterium]
MRPLPSPKAVHDLLRPHILVDGEAIVPDLARCRGSDLVDGRSGDVFLDFFTCYSTLPLGWNHPALFERDFLDELVRAAVNKPSNSDFYTPEFAAFVDLFGKTVLPAGYERTFFVDGGALAVENALKAAFDWRVKKNRAAGTKGEAGTQVLHFRHAFHGRSGYTLSLTNTADPRKVALFPKFPWPRVSSPACAFPLEGENLARTVAAERSALEEIDAALSERGEDVACILIEPIQCEGGDRHFRGEFLRSLRGMADEKGCLLVYDEVQTGFFATGKRWCFEHFPGAEPDLVAFGKKAQVCGFFAGQRLEEVPDNVLRESSRINSTWGGNLVDMVRSRRVLEIVRDEGLAENAAAAGELGLALLRQVSAEFPRLLHNVRGRGCLLAFDLPTPEAREEMMKRLYRRRLLALRCGTHSIRLRPALDVRPEAIERGAKVLAEAAREME